MVYKIDAVTGQETVLHSFNQTDGAYPIGGVNLDSSGNLYGTASSVGMYGYGAVFKIRAAGL